MFQFSIKAIARVVRWLTRIAVALAVALVVCALVLHWFIVPRIDDFRPRLQALATRALGTPVHIGALRAESNGLLPTIALHDVQVLDDAGRAGLQVPRALMAFSVLSLARGELEQLVIEQPTLDVRRTADGRLLVAGLDMSGDAAGDTAAADWFFSQPEFVVQNGQVRWLDEQRNVPPVALNAVQIVMRNGRHRHQMRLDATPDAPWGEPLTVIGRFRQPLLSRHPGQWQSWDGQVFAEFQRADVTRLRRYADLKTDWGVDLRKGSGALRLWADVAQGALTGATADVALGAVEVALGDGLEPLAFHSLTGRLGWQGGPGHTRFSTEGLQFTDADGLVWPGGNVQLHFGDAGAGPGSEGGELLADTLDLQALAKIAARLPLSDAVHQRLRQHPVQGQVQSVSARWQGPLNAPRDWRVQAQLSGLGVGAHALPEVKGEPTPGVPGLEGAELSLTATPAGGQATLAVRQGALSFPGVFEEPRIPVDELSLRAQWRVQGDEVALEVDDIALHNADATGRFKATWRTFNAAEGGEQRLPGVLDLQGSFSRANGARVHRYLPLAVPAEARHYVRDAVRQGQARNVAVHVKGDLRHVTDARPPEGTVFRFSGPVEGVTLDYVPASLLPAGDPPWPPLRDLAGELTFEHSAMRVRKAAARVQGHADWRFADIQTDIDDLVNPRVRVQAKGSGPLAAALGIVRASPVAGFTQHALDATSATGAAELDLKLDLPIDHIDTSRVEGAVRLPGNDLRFSPDTPLLAQAQGAVHFSETGFDIRDVQVQLLGGQARVSGGMNAAPDAPTPAIAKVRAQGTATAEGLRQMQDWAPLPGVARQASGSAAYEVELDFGAGGTAVRVQSDLRGMAFALPAPLDKPEGEAWPLLYETRPAAAKTDTKTAAHDTLRLNVGEQLALLFEHDNAAKKVHRGALGIGPQAVRALALPASGIHARLDAPRLDVAAWQQALQAVFGPASDAESSPYLPTQWQLRTDELSWQARSLHGVQVQATRSGQRWQGEVQALEMAGRVQYDLGQGQDPGRLYARLARLSIPDSRDTAPDTAPPAEPPADDPATRLPALDVEVQDFELRGRHLGQLQIQAVNRSAGEAGQTQDQTQSQTQEWQLTRLSLSTPEAALTASGRWAMPTRTPPPGVPARRRTALDLQLDIHDAGALLARFDMPGVLARGQGRIAGRLSWGDAPFSPHTPSMDGQLALDLGRGQFLKADPGIAKLLGVISLQALPRRLSLDFRDVFSTGFAFDAISGDVSLHAGVASTLNLQMRGAAALVAMEGSADLNRETQDLHVAVVPEIDAGGAALVATAFNPVVGIGAFLAQLVLQKPLARAATRQFHITGTWAEPQVNSVDNEIQKIENTPLSD